MFYIFIYMPINLLHSSRKAKTVAAAGCVAAAALCIWLASGPARQPDGQSLFDLARSEAQNLENTIDYGIVALQETARSHEVSQALQDDRISSDRNDRVHEELRNGLAAAGAKALSMELLNSTGTVLACYPSGKECAGVDMKLVPEVSSALRTRAETVGGFAQSPDGQLRLSVVTPIFIGGNFSGLARMTLKAPGGKYRDASLFSFVTDPAGTFIYHPSAGLQGKRTADALGPKFKDGAAALERAIAQSAKGEPETFSLRVPAQNGASLTKALCSLHPVDTPSGRWLFALAQRQSPASGAAASTLISLLSIALAGLSLLLLHRKPEQAYDSAAALPDAQPSDPALKKELAQAQAAASKAVTEFERLRQKSSETEERLASEILSRKKLEEELKTIRSKNFDGIQKKLLSEQDRLARELKEKDARIAELEKASGDISSAKKALEKTLSQSSSDKTEISKKLLELQALSSKLEQQAKQKDARINELEKETASLDASVKGKIAEQEKLVVQLATAKKLAATVDGEAAELKKNVAALEKQREDVLSELKKVSEARDAARNESLAILKEKETAKQHIQSCETEIKDLRARCEKQVQEHELSAKEKEQALEHAKSGLKHFEEQTHALKETVDNLSRTQAVYAAAFDGAGDGMALLVNGKAVLVNTTLCKMLGLKPEELSRINFLENLVPDPETQYYQTQDGQPPHKPSTPNFRLLLKNEHGQPLEFEASPSVTAHEGGPALMLVLRALSGRSPVARWRERSATLPDALLELDLHGKISFSNAAAANILGKSAQELPGAAFYSIFYKSDSKTVLASVSEALGGRASHVSARLVGDNNQLRWLRLISWPIFDDKSYPPKTCGAMCLLADISAEKTAELELRETEARLQAAVEASPFGLLLALLDHGNLMAVQANSAAGELFGTDLRKVSASSPLKLLERLPVEAVAKLENGLETSFELEMDFQHLPFASKRADTAWFKIAVVPLHGVREGLMAVTVEDISPAKAAVERAKSALQAQLSAAEAEKGKLQEKLDQIHKDSEKAIDGVRFSAQSERKAAEDRLDAAKDRIAFLEHELGEKERAAADQEKARYAAEKTAGTAEARAFSEAKKLKEELEHTSQELRTLRDNTQKLTGVALEQAKRMARCYEASPAPLLITDRKGIITFSSFQARTLLSGGSDLSGTRLSEYAQAPETVAADLVRANESSSIISFEWDFKTASGKKFTAEAHSALMPGSEGLAVHLQDVTEKKLREKELRASRGALLSIFRNAPFATVTTDFGGYITDANDAAAQLLNAKDRQSLSGRAFSSFVSKTDSERFTLDLKKAFERGTPLSGLCYTISSIQNREFPVEAAVSLYPDESGKPKGLVLAFADVAVRTDREEALRTEAARFKGLFESLPLLLVLEDAAGKLQEANPAFLSKSGWSAEEAAQKDWKQIFGIPPVSAEAGLPAALDAEYSRPGQPRRVIAWKAAQISGKDGAQLGASWVGEDVTSARQTLARVQDEQQLDHALFEHSKDPIIVIDSATATVRKINHEAELLLRVTSKEITGRTISGIIPPAYSSRYAQIFSEFMKDGGSPTLVEAHICDSDGRIIPVEISAATVTFKGTRLTITVMRDITQRREHENALSHGKRAAEEDSRARAEFLAGMSQEIRVSLSGMAAYANTLLRTNLNETQRDYVHAIAAGSETLMTLAAGALDLSRLDAGVLTPKQDVFDMEDLFQTLTGMFKLRSGAKTLRFSAQLEAGCPRYLKGDAGLVRRILVNLLDNAIKFTDKGAVKLSAARAAGEGSTGTAEAGSREKIIFTVADTGFGMTTQELDHAFDKFTPETGTPRLGLPVAKSLAGLMGGKLWPESKKGRGSRFYLELEFGIPAQDEENKAEKTPVQISGSVLVVEDNPINLNLARLMLENAGFEVTAAGSGTEALELFRERRFDFIFLDLEMPDKNGYDTVREMRRLEKAAHRQPGTPIAGLTAKPSPEEKERCLTFGMNDYLSKPLKANDMVTAISKWLGKAKLPE